MQPSYPCLSCFAMIVFLKGLGAAMTFVDELMRRLADAQQRVQLSQNRLQLAQSEHQAVMQELQSLQVLINLERHRPPHGREGRQTPDSTPPPPEAGRAGTGVATEIVSHRVLPPPNQESSVPTSNGAEVNKTEIVRDVLRRNPTGITPAQIWMVVRDRVDRPYVYSVLKRLKDNRQVTERRGKYYLVVQKAEEGNTSIVE